MLDEGKKRESVTATRTKKRGFFQKKGVYTDGIDEHYLAQQVNKSMDSKVIALGFNRQTGLPLSISVDAHGESLYSLKRTIRYPSVFLLELVT